MSAIEDLATELARLPGIGRKTAFRLTYHLLKQPPEQGRRLGQALLALGERVHTCERCFNYTDEALCAVCRDPRRDQSVVCVVEEASDIGAIERAGEFRGVYHVLGGRLAPLDGVGPEDLTLDRLVARVQPGGPVREVIVATNPSVEGETTALLVRQELGRAGVTDVAVTRIALGLPVGGDLEYADGVTIARALAARRAM
ncbi:MAG TPA: recombination mediator RecR [Gemmatimonadaceae bacterium]|nr:recombination mediator RecR [Gemmatimonadaceae bacterium]